jgi:MFS transporter, FHS family, glucose/mannose:H+ symporter
MKAQTWGKLKILVTFTCLSLMCSGLPVFVLQAVSYYKASPIAAGTLESYMNIPIILCSLVMFSILLKTGFKKSLIITYIVTTIACFLIPFFNSLWAIRAYLIITGIIMVSVKVICYSSVGLVTNNKEEHASFINILEALFTTGWICGMWLFSYFLKVFPEHWIYIFWVFSGLSIFLLILWTVTPFNESEIKSQEDEPILKQFKGLIYILGSTFILFVLLLGSYESLEQGIGSWLPSFNHQVLGIQKYLSVEVASMLTLSIALGRFVGAFVVRYVKWYKMLFVNFIIAIGLFICIIMEVQQGAGASAETFLQLPLIAFGIPLIGFFIGPVYPTLASSVMTSFSKKHHALIISLIMILGSFFDSVSSKIIGILFAFIGGISAFTYAILIPLIILLICVIPYYKLTNKKNQDNQINAA